MTGDVDHVRMGECLVRRGPAVLGSLGLGSCVAVMVLDREAAVGGLAHVLLPSASLARSEGHPLRYADTAVPQLLAELERHGGQTRRTEAWLVGGASMFANLLPAGALRIGHRNVTACRLALRAAGVPVVGEAVGGEGGRSVWLDVGRGVVTVRAVGGTPHVL